jgi:hypothetical protein
VQEAAITKTQDTYNTQTKQVDDTLAQERFYNLRKPLNKELVYKILVSWQKKTTNVA